MNILNNYLPIEQKCLNPKTITTLYKIISEKKVIFIRPVILRVKIINVENSGFNGPKRILHA